MPGNCTCTALCWLAVTCLHFDQDQVALISFSQSQSSPNPTPFKSCLMSVKVLNGRTITTLEYWSGNLFSNSCVCLEVDLLDPYTSFIQQANFCLTLFGQSLNQPLSLFVPLWKYSKSCPSICDCSHKWPALSYDHCCETLTCTFLIALHLFVTSCL